MSEARLEAAATNRSGEEEEDHRDKVLDGLTPVLEYLSPCTVASPQSATTCTSGILTALVALLSEVLEWKAHHRPNTGQ